MPFEETELGILKINRYLKILLGDMVLYFDIFAIGERVNGDWCALTNLKIKSKIPS